MPTMVLRAEREVRDTRHGTPSPRRGERSLTYVRTESKKWAHAIKTGRASFPFQKYEPTLDGFEEKAGWSSVCRTGILSCCTVERAGASEQTRAALGAPVLPSPTCFPGRQPPPRRRAPLPGRAELAPPAEGLSPPAPGRNSSGGDAHWLSWASVA